MTIQTITDAAEFAKLRDEWNALVGRSTTGFITQTWEWLLTWWETFGDGRALRILLARDKGKLIGIAPLLTRTVREFGLSVRRMEFLASGEDEADEICSDYLDLIVEPGREQEVIAALLEQMTDCDEVRLVSVLNDSPCLAALRGVVGATDEARKQSLWLPLAGDWESFLKTQSRNFRWQLKRRRQKLTELGRLEFVEASGNFDSVFEEFAVLHQQWWMARGKPGCFASEKFMRFHRDVAQRLLPLGRVHLFHLRLDGKLLAARLNYSFDGRMLDYQTGVDPTFDPQAGVGGICTGYCVEAALTNGMTAYDFGEGLHDYKTRWKGELRETRTVTLRHAGVKQMVRAALRRGKDALRQTKRKLHTPNTPHPIHESKE